MKKVVFFLATIFLSLHSFAQIEAGGSTDGSPSPKVWLETNVYHFGKVPLDIPVTTTFVIKNTGNAALLFTKVEASCNCTLVEYTQEEIKPGETGFVKATFDAKIMGVFDKRIFLYTNAYEGEIDLILKGEVIYISEK